MTTAVHSQTPATTEPSAGSLPQRIARPRRYLMCRPGQFDVTYEINAWMHADVGVDRELALRQWENLRQTYLTLGHRVDVIEGAPGLPDMVFAANAGTVIGGVAVAARFLRPERQGEEAPYTEWFRGEFDTVVVPEFVNEGEGDYLWTGSKLLAASGFRGRLPLDRLEVVGCQWVPHRSAGARGARGRARRRGRPAAADQPVLLPPRHRADRAGRRPDRLPPGSLQ